MVGVSTVLFSAGPLLGKRQVFCAVEAKTKVLICLTEAKGRFSDVMSRTMPEFYRFHKDLQTIAVGMLLYIIPEVNGFINRVSIRKRICFGILLLETHRTGTDKGPY